MVQIYTYTYTYTYTYAYTYMCTYSICLFLFFVFWTAYSQNINSHCGMSAVIVACSHGRKILVNAFVPLYIESKVIERPAAFDAIM